MNNNALQMLMQLMGAKQNPNTILNNMISKNPQANIIMNQMKQSGMSPKQFLEQYAKQNNIDLKPYYDMFSQNGIKL